MSPEERIANAVVEQAAKDYRAAIKKLKRNPDNEIAEIQRKECEEFFLSPNFNRFTRIDGKMLMKKLREEYKDDTR